MGGVNVAEECGIEWLGASPGRGLFTQDMGEYFKLSYKASSKTEH